jgi:coproporphyrinogen III oxidase
MSPIDSIKPWLLAFQRSLALELGTLDGSEFLTDIWEKKPGDKLGGGGISRLLEGGDVIERGGVMFSHVNGLHLPPTAAAARPEAANRSWEALGVSVVIHPRNPYAPTAHMNVRLFNAKGNPDVAESDIWWVGGGMDLTPYYGFEKDAARWHGACKSALDPFGRDYYPRFKTWCDEYFYLKHRQEPRGIGGVFFDDLYAPGLEVSLGMIKSIGAAFQSAYIDILGRRKDTPYTQREREFQAYRRGRYVEFNLVFDRGTHFGLQSGGRTESILASMPPGASWRYNWQPEAGSPEEELYTKYLKARDWISA